MDRHQGNQLAALDQRHANRGGDADVLEGLRLVRRDFLQVIIDDQRSARLKFADRQRTEVGEAVVADDRGRARNVPIAADGEAVLILVHVGVSTIGQTEMLGGQASRDCKDIVGAGGPGGCLPDPVEELEQGFAVNAGTLDGASRVERRIAMRVGGALIIGQLTQLRAPAHAEG